MEQRIVVLLVAACLLAGCVRSAEPSDVAASSYPALYLVEALAGADLRVAALGGSAVHHYEPGAHDLDALRKTGTLVIWDPVLETWSTAAVARLGQGAPEVHALLRLPEGDHAIRSGHEAHDAATEGPDADEGHEDHEEAEPGKEEAEAGPIDPHTWLDPLAMQASAEALVEHLDTLHPRHADNITARGVQLADQLQALHQDFDGRLTDCRHDVVVTNHNAYGYLARRYGFTIQSLHGIEPGSEPGPADVQQAIATIRDLGLPTLFVEEGTDPRVVSAIAKETDVDVRVLHTLETQPPEGDYITMQRTNLDALVEALACP